MRPSKYPFTPNPGVQLAIQKAGGQTALSKIVGIRQCTISQYLRRENAPECFALKVEQELGVPREMTRPVMVMGDHAK
jgi:protein involved in polysaccharide export with SLBB domain